MAGINEYDGDTFRNFTRGDSVPFTFTFTEDDEVTPIPVTGYKMYVSFNDTLETGEPLVESEIPMTDELNGIFSGFFEDSDSIQVPAGTAYASAFYIDADGRKFIVDMAQIEVFEGVSSRTDQT